MQSLYPLGRVTDHGDLIHQERWLVKGQRPVVVFHWGAPEDTTPADRVPSGTPTPAPQEAEQMTDLHADKKITRTAAFKDEFRNPTQAPAGSTQTMESDNPALVTVTDNGAGGFVIAAVGGLGNLGVANVIWTLTKPVGDQMVRVDAINVIAGDAEVVDFEDSAEEEVTPDDVPTPEDPPVEPPAEPVVP